MVHLPPVLMASAWALHNPSPPEPPRTPEQALGLTVCPPVPDQDSSPCSLAQNSRPPQPCLGRAGQLGFSDPSYSPERFGSHRGWEVSPKGVSVS